MQGFIAAFGLSPWGPMALAFVVGVAFGWAVWGVKKQDDEADSAGQEAEPKEIVIIKAELQAARTLLESRVGEEADEITEQISSLDETVKRANGRLKLILSAVKRAARQG